MGCFNVLCPVCGICLNGIDKSYKIPRKWISNVTLLLPNKKPMHKFYEIYGSTTFTNGKTTIDLPVYGKNKGVAVHTDCWIAFNRITDNTLTYNYFKGSKLNKYGYLLKNINYSPINAYLGQFLDIDRIIESKDKYILMTPLKNKQNARRIIKIIKKIYMDNKN
jgi:hypothetical protein